MLTAFWALLAVAGMPAAANNTTQDPGASAADERVQYAAAPKRISDFSLTDHATKPFTSRDLLGRTSLVFFGFTNCQSVCPPTMTKLRQVARALADEKAPFTNVLVSVDAERDTPAAMARFLEPFMPGFVGLTGDAAAIRDLAGDFSAVFFRGMPTDTKGGYNVEHTPQVYLVDRMGRLRATFYNASVDAMVDATRRVMLED
jgi:protein SCO1/2